MFDFLIELGEYLRKSVPPSIALALVLAPVVWILVEGVGETVALAKQKHLDVLRPILMRIAPIFVGVGLCSVPGLTDWILDGLGYEGRKWTSGLGQGVGVGLVALALHGLGFRHFLEAALRRRFGRKPVNVALVLVLPLLVGCGAAWPTDKCELIDREWRCRCAVREFVLTPHPTKPSPAATVKHLCDGTALPLTEETDDCGLPRCAP